MRPNCGCIGSDLQCIEDAFAAVQFSPARAIPRAIRQSLEEEEGDREGGRSRRLSDERRESRVEDDDDADGGDKGLLEAGLTYMQGRKPATTAVTFVRVDVTPYRCKSDVWSLRSQEL